MVFEIRVYKDEKLTNVYQKNSKKDCEDWFNELKNLGKFTEDHTYLIEDVTERERVRQLVKQNEILGTQYSACCKQVLNFVTGYNIHRQLDVSKIEKMVESFGQIFNLLNLNRAESAKEAIQAVETDDDLITSDLKNGCLQIFDDHAI